MTDVVDSHIEVDGRIGVAIAISLEEVKAHFGGSGCGGDQDMRSHRWISQGSGGTLLRHRASKAVQRGSCERPRQMRGPGESAGRSGGGRSW